MDRQREILSKDYEELQDVLVLYPAISIVSVEKDPPEKYVIEYKLFGYGYASSGEVQMRRRHRIEINLPFGYPHLPPIVKPLSQICHPDVAEHAVRIAGFWQSNQSLADLVVHIGKMICGEVYSTEGAFNQNAAKWYKAHQQKLPLAELKYLDPNRKQTEPIIRGEIPYKIIVAIVLLGIVASGGGLFYRDRLILTASEKHLLQVENGIANHRFEEASYLVRGTLESLDGVLFFKSVRDRRKAELTGILESVAMREGLGGRALYQGKYLPMKEVYALQKMKTLQEAAAGKITDGDPAAADVLYSTAIRLAEDNGFAETAEELRQVSAEKRLKYYIESANASYREQKWQEADDNYGQAIATLQHEKANLSANYLATLEKLEKLKILTKVNVYRHKAVQSEQAEEYEQAAKQYREIVSLIGQSSHSMDPVLKRVAVNAEQEGTRVVEQGLISAGTEYLLNNYKDIFTENYPGLHGPALQSPQVRYMGSTSGKLLFILSCIELIQRHASEYRIYYQYDTVTGKWSVYSDQ